MEQDTEQATAESGRRAVIEVRDLQKRYGTLHAVRGVSFDVWEGEIFGLLGPNGAGKTTTMEMIEGLRKPTSGQARVAGYDTGKQLEKVKAVIGVQLQSTSLFELLTVREIIRMYASFYEQSVPLEPLLQSVMLEEKAEARVKNLSGGQKQRLAIALALVNDPVVVFLDEPTTGLDPQARRTLWDIIRNLKEQGKTIVLSTHYMDEAHILCDRICLIDSGRIIALDTPDRLVKRLQSRDAVEFSIRPREEPEADETGEEAEKMRRYRDDLERIASVKQVEVRKGNYVLYTDFLQQTLTDLIRWADEREVDLIDLKTRTATLEDVFIHMTGRSLRES